MKTLKTFTLILITLLLTNCSTIEQYSTPVANHEVMITIDLSGSSDSTKFPSTVDIVTYILKEIRMVEGEHFANGATIYLSYLGHEYRPYIKPIILPAVSSSSNRTKRKRAVLGFKQELYGTIDAILKLPVNKAGSNLFSGLAYQFEIMHENNFSDQHSILLISDCVEFSAYDFSDPKTFKDMAALSDQLNEAFPFGNLSGFDITILSVENSTAHRAQEFTKYHFIRNGASSRIRSNLLSL